MSTRKGAVQTRRSGTKVQAVPATMVGARYELPVDGDEDTFVLAKVLPHGIEVSVCGDHKAVRLRIGAFDHEANIAREMRPNGQFSVTKDGKVLETFKVPKDHQVEFIQSVQPVALAS